MKIAIFLFSFLSVTGWAQGLPTGTYKGTRTCSDGSVPTDTLSKNPVFISLRADGFYTSSADLFSKNGGVCSELTSGEYRFSGGILSTTSEVLDQCGACGDHSLNRQRSQSRAEIELIGSGFILRTYTDYKAGGSCKPGQFMSVRFERLNELYEDLSRSCQPVEAS